jgi:hypothetical protein
MLITASTVLMAGCGSSGSSNLLPGPNPNPSGPQVSNVQQVLVGPGPTGNDVNTLLTTITVCVPGTMNCQTIPNIQVDTGSSGLRLLASQLSLSFPEVMTGGSPVGNCINFADNSYMWGPVALADIRIAGETASSIPIQVVSPSNFPAVPSSCNSGGTAISSPVDLGANGVLGIGVFRQDCGAGCAPSASQVPPVYFACPATGCVPTALPIGSQLQNPVWLFPQDNNGFLISLPAVSATGVLTIGGSLIFGIGTQSNNSLAGTQVFTTDANGNISTTFNGTRYSSSFIDTGSNGLFFLDTTATGLPDCGTSATGFYCPASTANFSVILTGTNGVSTQVAFSIANALALFNTGNTAFNNLGGSNPETFDFGLPFFFGRNVFIGIEGQITPGGIGPFWAF